MPRSQIGKSFPQVLVENKKSIWNHHFPAGVL